MKHIIVDTDIGPLQLPEDLCMLPAMRRDATWEPHVGEVLRRFLKPGSTFVDIGAHVGYFSRLASNLVGETGKVFAFEPMPELFAALKANVAGRPVECFNLAAWDSERHLILFVNPANSGDNSIVASDTSRCWHAVDVQAVRVEDFLPRGIVPDLIKIDVQGAELRAIRGMDFLLAKHLPPLVVECSPMHLDAAETPLDVLLSYCRRLGYRGCQELGDVAENRERGYWDVVFTEDEQ